MRRRAFAGVAMAALLTTLAASGGRAAEPPHLRPSQAKPVIVEGSFGFTGDKEKKLRRSGSGIACANAKTCVVAFDEGREARWAELSPEAYRAGAAVALPTSGVEADAEAVATDGTQFFVTGSHAMKRKTCEPNPTSRFVARVAADGTVSAGDILPAIDAVPALRDALGKCLAGGVGLDIEGLAASGGHLWFGFRGPRPAAGAHVLRVDARAPFEGGDLAPKPFVVDVGPARAIRDMQAVGDKLLLLAGPPAGVDDAARYALVLFDPAASGADASKTLATLDFSTVERRDLGGCKDEKLDEVKPEGLMVADPARNPWDVAILSDGLCDGGPLWFKVAH